jgi:hypothetical protein
MLRPPASKVVAEIQCPQCTKPLQTLYQCDHEGATNIEMVAIKCRCGYEYLARSRHGKELA